MMLDRQLAFLQDLVELLALLTAWHMGLVKPAGLDVLSQLIQ